MSESTLLSSLEQLITTYNQAINEANIQSLTDFFTSNGVLMPQGAPAVLGKADIFKAYTSMLAMFRLRVNYQVDNIQNDGGLAIVQTHSNGTSTMQSSGLSLPVNNKEIFVLQKESDQWKIALYIFNNNLRS